VEKPFGKYLLLGRLGGGGMAEVFRARFKGLEGFEKLVALKLILRNYSNDPEFVRMFVQEASLSARLDHANIVRVYEFDQIDDRYYIAMELVDGQDLRKVLLRCRELGRALSVPEALIIALEICKGLAFAHGEIRPGAPEIVHRDISPHNIILSRAGEVKITDFGIAKLVSAASRTKTGLIKGKVGYMSPEQARGEPVDRRTDLFALGCILWEMLAGKRLFTGANDQAVLYNLQTMHIPKVSYCNAEAGEAIDRLLTGLLQRDPEQRTDSAKEVLTAIDCILQGYPNVQRSTLLAELYSVLFSDVSENLSTDVLPLHQQIADERTAPTGDAILETKNEQPSDPSVSDKQTIPYQKTALVSEEDQVTLGNRPKSKKGVLTGLIIAAGLIVAGFVGYGVWDKLSRDDALPDASNTTESAPTPATNLEAPTLTPPQPDPAENQAPPPTTDTPNTSADQVPPGSETKTVVLQSTPRVKNSSSVTSRAERPDKQIAALPPGSGLLQLYSTPPCFVYDGDNLLGQTLLELVLPAGEYTLLLVSVKDKDTTRKVKVTVRPQQITRNKFVVR
jgi:serine/threonine protein kinase